LAHPFRPLIADRAKSAPIRRTSFYQRFLKYRPKEYFGAEFQKQIDIYYKEILEECGYNATTTRFNLPDFDIEIDGHKKSGYQGQGYCSFINSVTALVFRRYLAYHAKYDPGFLIIDTPLLGLDQGVEDAAPESMRAGLFKYFINHQNEGQIIILENIMHIPTQLLRWRRKCHYLYERSRNGEVWILKWSKLNQKGNNYLKHQN